jgi:hypothetical protein
MRIIIPLGRLRSNREGKIKMDVTNVGIVRCGPYSLGSELE